MGKFAELRVWKEAMDVAEKIYKISETEKLKSDFGLRNQIRRSAVSIASNIAEGDELDTIKQAIRHFFIARGSAAELITQLILAKRIGYLEESVADTLIDQIQKISAMLNNLIKARNARL